MTSIFVSGVKPSGGQIGFNQIGLSFKPTATQIFTAAAKTAFEGPGSVAQDVAATEMGQETGLLQGFSNVLNYGMGGILTPETTGTPSRPITEEEWKSNKDYFRQDLKYRQGMTTKEAEILAKRRDAQFDRDVIMSKAEGFAQGTAFWTGSFIGAMADAKNVAFSVAAGVGTNLAVGALAAGPAAPAAEAGAATIAGGAGLLAGAARVGKTLLRLNSAGIATLKASHAAKIAAVMAESVASTVPQAVTGFQNAAITQQKYDGRDATLDLLASAGLGVAFHGVSEAAGAAWRRYASPNDAVDLGHMVTQQVAAGEKIDVEPLVHQKLADYVPEVASVEFTPRFVQEGGSGKKIRFRAEQDVYGEVLTSRVFNDKKAAEADLKEQFLARSVQVAKELGLPPEQLAQLEAVAQIRARVRTFDGEKMATEMVDRTPTVTRAKEKLAIAEQKLAEAKPKKQAARQRGVEAARQELEAARQAERPLMLQAAQAEKAKLQGLLTTADNTIRDLQRKSAAARLPQYAKAQLDMSPEGRAARSIDQKGSRIMAEEVPDTKFDPEAPTPPHLVAEVEAMVASLGDTKMDKELREAIAETGVMEDIPAAVNKFLKCRAGR